MSYFKRQIELWGEQTQELLPHKSIAIIGCGGLGCSVAIALGSSGVGQIELVDFDTVSTHNIHRQIAFELGDEEKPKCEVLAQKLQKRCNSIRANAHFCDFSDFATKNIKTDLIIDATDNLSTRVLIEQYAKENNTPWLHGAVEEWRGQVCFFEKASFAGSFAVTNQKPSGVTPPQVINIASFEALLALRYLAGQEIRKDKFYMFYFTNDGDFEKREFDLALD